MHDSPPYRSHLAMLFVPDWKRARARHVQAFVAWGYTIALPHLVRLPLEPRLAQQYVEWMFPDSLLILSPPAVPLVMAVYLARNRWWSVLLVGIATSAVAAWCHRDADLEGAGPLFLVGVLILSVYGAGAGMIVLALTQVRAYLRVAAENQDLPPPGDG